MKLYTRYLLLLMTHFYTAVSIISPTYSVAKMTPTQLLSQQVQALQPYAQKSTEELSAVEQFITNKPTKIHHVPIREEHGLELYQHWADQALSSLIACVANRKLAEIRASAAKRHVRAVEKEFGECSKEAVSVPLHARYASRLLRDEIHGSLSRY